jgi:hypothetical protein
MDLLDTQSARIRDHPPRWRQLQNRVADRAVAPSESALNRRRAVADQPPVSSKMELRNYGTVRRFCDLNVGKCG